MTKNYGENEAVLALTNLNTHKRKNKMNYLLANLDTNERCYLTVENIRDIRRSLDRAKIWLSTGYRSALEDDLKCLNNTIEKMKNIHIDY